MSFHILVTAARLEPAGLSLLEAAGCTVDFVSLEGGRAEMERKLATTPVQGVISRAIPITGAAMASCPSLRVISRAAVGYDLIDVEGATARGIPVLTAVGANAQSVAEYSLGLMLAVARNIPRHTVATQGGAWDRSRMGIELHGRRLGLVGYGRIAQGLARMALAIGMKVSAYSPNLARRGDIAPVTAAASLHDLLRQSDVVSLHAPMSAQNRQMIGAAELALLGPEAILVNTGRGGLIDEAALAEVLREGRIYGAGLDVLSTEPPLPGNPLIGVPNAVLSPHMGAATTVARSATAQAAATHVLAALRGQALPPDACVNPQALGVAG
ncbi:MULTISPECIES: NAD(P)-dependent oxidoreductase [Roseomonadaceae]|uniref:3-phosphoglycerate dehydrogenase n=1 Tax=Falsiroseomonas oleicola TaxID=2801474 RepID=A0ABS6H607_9PROT|nr:NAD(P)-dependent oxidoreductase [Roseomonas oleicola]MBU8544127.1 3-phosphoglycerate dehydrogenase [Roseomonas oleicola]